MSILITPRQRRRQVSSLTTTDEFLYEQFKSSNLFSICLPLIIKQGSISIERIRSTIRELMERYEKICRTLIDVKQENHFSIQIIHTQQNVENIANFLTKIDNDRTVRFYLIKKNQINAEYLHSDDLIIIVFHRLVFNLISLESFLHIFIQIYDNNDQFILNLSDNIYESILNKYDSNNHSLLSNLRYSIDFILDSNIINNQIQFSSSNDLTLFQINLACFLLFLYKLNENSIDDLCILCSTDLFTRVHPIRISMNSNESFINFACRIQQLCTNIIEYNKILSIYDGFNSFNIPFYFKYNNFNIDLTMKEISLEIYPNEILLSKKYEFLSNLSLIMIYDENLHTLNCTLTGSDDFYKEKDIVDISQKFQRFLTNLFSKTTTTTINQELIHRVSLPSLNESIIQRRLSIFDADLPSAITIDSEYGHSYRKWLGVIWLVIELNLVSGNIYGFTALSKVLPRYNIYNDHCISINNNNSTELDCHGQIKVYQNALTLGLIFFNIPSVFTGTLIDRYGTRFTRLIAIGFYILGWFALVIIEPGRDGLLFVHTLFTSLAGKMIQMSAYASANYFSKARAYVLTAFVGSSSASPIWYSLFQVLINKQILTLHQIASIWMSIGALLLCSSFLFLDWTFSILNLPYKFDTHLEENSSNNESEQKWYKKIYQRQDVWEHIFSPLYILLILFLSILIMPSVFLSVTWYPWVYFITNNSIKQTDNYTLVYNFSTLLMLVLCPLTGFLLGFRAETSFKRKCLNISIIQTFSWALNIISCIVYMSMTRATIISAIIINSIARATLISSSQAVVATFFPSKYIGRLTGIMWSVVGLTICLQYGLIKLTMIIPDSWRQWV